jgi:hypothetical protein
VCGSLLGTIGAALSVLLGFGPGVALLAALAAMIMLPLLRVFHPPGVALAMCPALLHSGAWFAVLVVLPFTLAAVISCAALPRATANSPRCGRRSTHLLEPRAVRQETSRDIIHNTHSLKYDFTDFLSSTRTRYVVMRYICRVDGH